MKKKEKAKLSRAAQEYEMLYREGKLTEFAIVCLAKGGDKAALEWTWFKYRDLMVGMIRKYWWYHRLTENEVESEAIMAMLHKLENVFKPEKVTRPPETWQFKYMLINAAWHRRSKLKTKQKNGRLNGCLEDETDEKSATPENCIDDASDEEVLDVNSHRYYAYNPEKQVIKETEEPFEIKEKRLMEMLTPLQKTLVELKKAGMTVQQIADHMGCSFTKVRKQIVQTRGLFCEVLGVSA